MKTAKRAYDRKVTVRIDKGLLDKAKKVAETLGMTLSNYIRYCLRRDVFIDDPKAPMLGD